MGNALLFIGFLLWWQNSVKYRLPLAKPVGISQWLSCIRTSWLGALDQESGVMFSFISDSSWIYSLS